jgi:hypothetical protein
VKGYWYSYLTTPVQVFFLALPEYPSLNLSMGSGGLSGKRTTSRRDCIRGTLLFHSPFYPGLSCGQKRFCFLRMTTVAPTYRSCGDATRLLTLLLWLPGTPFFRSPFDRFPDLGVTHESAHFPAPL